MTIQSRRLDALGWTGQDWYGYLAITLVAALSIAVILTICKKKDFMYFFYTLMLLISGSMTALTTALAIRTLELKDVWFPFVLAFGTFMLWLMRRKRFPQQ